MKTKKIKISVSLLTFLMISVYSSIIAQAINISSNRYTSYKTIFHDNGELMIAQKFIDNEIVQQESYYSDGVLKERFGIVNNKSHGVGVLYFPSGNVQEKYRFNNGKLIGDHIKYYTNKNLRFIRTYNNKETLSETGTWFYPFDGSVSTRFYYDKNGEIHGVHIEYPKDKYGNSLSVVKTYFDQGNEISEIQYNHNKKQS